MNSLFCLIHIAYAFPSKLDISTSEFSHFYLSYSLPHPLSKEGASGCVELSCLLVLTHNRKHGTKGTVCKLYHRQKSKNKYSEKFRVRRTISSFGTND